MSNVTDIHASVFERRHYERIAIIIANMPDIERWFTAYHFADMLADNPRFDRTTFLRACGVIT